MQPLDHFDTSNVVGLRSTFHSASAFNQALPWDTRRVTEMKHVFAFASSFNQPLNWNVSSVVRFEEMFQECVALSDCHRAMTSAAFTDSNFRFGCSSGDPRGIYRCSVGHGVFSDACDGCGNYESWSSLPLCSPSEPPPPPMPPFDAASVMAYVTATVTTAGSTSDYTPAVQTAIIEKMAAECGVAVGAVTMTVLPGSVILSFTIGVTSSDDATSVTGTLNTRLADANAASAFLSTSELDVTVTAVQSATMLVPPAAPPTTPPTSPLPTPPTTPPNWLEHQWPLVVIPIIGVLLLITIFFFFRFLSMRKTRLQRARLVAQRNVEREIASEYDASVLFAIMSLPTRVHKSSVPSTAATDAPPSIELTTLGKATPPDTATNSGASSPEVSMRPGMWVVSSIGNLFSSSASTDEGAECAVCLCPFEDGCTLRVLPCNHSFHKACSACHKHERTAPAPPVRALPPTPLKPHLMRV